LSPVGDENSFDSDDVDVDIDVDVDAADTVAVIVAVATRPQQLFCWADTVKAFNVGVEARNTAANAISSKQGTNGLLNMVVVGFFFLLDSVQQYCRRSTTTIVFQQYYR